MAWWKSISIVSPVCITFANAGFPSEHAENHKSDAAVMFTRRVPAEELTGNGLVGLGLTGVVVVLATGLAGATGSATFAAGVCAGDTACAGDAFCAGTTGGIIFAIVGDGVGLAATPGAGTTGVCAVASGFAAAEVGGLFVAATEAAGAVTGATADVGNAVDVAVELFACSATEGIVSGPASRCTL